jgi:hypothetical protein
MGLPRLIARGSWTVVAEGNGGDSDLAWSLGVERFKPESDGVPILDSDVANGCWNASTRSNLRHHSQRLGFFGEGREGLDALQTAPTRMLRSDRHPNANCKSPHCRGQTALLIRTRN